MGPLFVQVAVENTVYHFDRLFTYALPAELEQVVVPGMRVMAPFGTAKSVILPVKEISRKFS